MVWPLVVGNPVPTVPRRTEVSGAIGNIKLAGKDSDTAKIRNRCAQLCGRRRAERRISRASDTRGDPQIDAVRACGASRITCRSKIRQSCRSVDVAAGIDSRNNARNCCSSRTDQPGSWYDGVVSGQHQVLPRPLNASKGLPMSQFRSQ
jgi:hypothetical protein